MALGAQGVWTGSMWLLTTEADMYPEVTENLLAADVERRRPGPGHDRQAGTPAAHDVDRGVGAPGRARPAADAAAGAALRRGRGALHPCARQGASPGTPSGQIVGSIDQVRPASDVVLDDGRRWIETTERLGGLMAD